MANLSLVFDLLAKDNASKAFKDVGDAAEHAGKKGEGFGSSLSSGLKIAGAAFVASGIVEGFKSFYDAAAESAKIGALTQAAITSTGGAAKVTADQVGDLVTAISNKTGVDDEAIQSGANLLLTFTNVKNEAGKGNDIFTQTTQIMTDMSVALGTDASGSAIQLGKALNDPVKGVTALQKVGVSFTDSQKEQIKTLVATGDTLGAQKVILAELNKEFGGAAAAASTPLDKLKVNLGNLQEQIGGYLIPIVDKAASFFLNTLLPGLERVGGYIGDKLAPVFSTIGGIAKQAFDILFKGDFKGGPLSEDSKVVDILFRLRDGLGTIAGVAKQAFDVIFHGDFKGGPLSEDSKAVDVLFRIRDGFQAVAGYVTGTVVPAFQRIGDYIAANFIPTVQRVGDFFTGTLFPAIGQVAGFLIQTFTPTVRALVGYFTDHWLPAIQGIRDKFVEFQPQLTQVAQFIGVVAAAVGFLVAKIAGFLLPIIINLAGALFDTLGAAIGAAIGFIAGIVDSINFLVSAFKATFNWVKDHWPLLLGILTGPIGLAVVLLTQHFDTIKAGAETAWHWVVDKFTSMKDGVVGIFTTIRDTVGTVWNGLLDKVKTPIRVVFDFVNNSMIGPINSLLGKFPGGLHIPNLPGFTAGGYTGDGDKHQPMGVVHGGEYVFTKEETAKAGPANLAMLAKTLRGYDIGGFVGNIGSSIGGAVGGAVDWVKDIAEKGARKVAELVLNPLRNTAKGLIPGGNVIGDVVRGFVDKLADSVLGKSDDQDKAQRAAMTATGAIGSGVQRWAPLVAQALAMLGQPGSLIPTVLRRMNQESGGNAAAINNWDINAKNGVPSKGLMQVIDPTFRANALPGYSSNIYDPMSNILASMQYAIRRYGSLSAAYNKAGGYETGTNWVPETGPYILHKGEAVVPAAANAGWTGGGPMTIQLDGAAVTDLLEGRVVNVLTAVTDRGAYNR